MNTRISLAREIAQESIVLLKNEDHILPFIKGTKIALFGRTQYDTVIGGGGSGASYTDKSLQIVDEFKKSAFELDPSILAFYQEQQRMEKELNAKESASKQDVMRQLAGLVASGAIYDIFGRYEAQKPEPIPTGQCLEDSKAETAVIVIGRTCGGEECDRHIQDDYYLTESEKQLVNLVTHRYQDIVVILNINGACDTRWIQQYPQIKAVLFMGSCGEQGAGALLDILSGNVSPSGKLSQTFANCYEDYPSSAHFSEDKDGAIKDYAYYGLSAEENGSCGYAISPVSLYQERIYVGYRYFDTFNKDVMFSFGHGLSYAEFSLKLTECEMKENCFCSEIKVTNLSERYAGKEVIQAYISKPEHKLDQPLHELKAYAKTKCLKPGESQILNLEIPFIELASFDENTSCYVIEQGNYVLSIGSSLTEAKPCAVIQVSDQIITECVTADIGLSKCNRGKLKILSKKQSEKICNQMTDQQTTTTGIMLNLKEKNISKQDIKAQSFDLYKEAVPSTITDVMDGKVSVEEFVNQMSMEELAVMCNGYGPGLPFGGIGAETPSTITDQNGNEIAYGSHKTAISGYMSPAIKKYEIKSIGYKDGPSSVGGVAWPTGMMLGCCFNEELLERFGYAIGQETVDIGIQSWLAPGLNIIRNPIQGRAFEYFSEDPFVVGKTGIAICRGAMQHKGLTACPKHFALNEQETYRRGSGKKNIDAVDSIVDARTAREIYLKPFEMVVKEVKPKTLMTSFNKINGCFAAANKVLCQDILRGEWGYDGIVITDWGDMDVVVDGADAVAAGNDVVMPGGPPVIGQVLRGYEEGRVTLEELRTAVAHVVNVLVSLS
ncbi:MAG: glycoside hydrolase family 3 C-terminal domain-containing protein [Clostridiales bacterium]|nr:glycoside hydrolase family 3 C-terminal domain-containing protein [Clostridiales bacterium]